MGKSFDDLAERLKQNGLEGPAFDLAAIADGLAGWLDAGEDLSRLLDDHPIGDPTAFDPDWK